MKQITITEEENGGISLKADKGIKWTTFITGIEMMIDTIFSEAKLDVDIDDILEDIKRIYLRDKED